MNFKDYGLSREWNDSYLAQQEIRRVVKVLKFKVSIWEPRPYVSPCPIHSIAISSCGCDGRGL